MYLNCTNVTCSCDPKIQSSTPLIQNWMGIDPIAVPWKHQIKVLVLVTFLEDSDFYQPSFLHFHSIKINCDKWLVGNGNILITLILSGIAAMICSASVSTLASCSPKYKIGVSSATATWVFQWLVITFSIWLQGRLKTVKHFTFPKCRTFSTLAVYHRYVCVKLISTYHWDFKMWCWITDVYQQQLLNSKKNKNAIHCPNM